MKLHGTVFQHLWTTYCNSHFFGQLYWFVITRWTFQLAQKLHSILHSFTQSLLSVSASFSDFVMKKGDTANWNWGSKLTKHTLESVSGNDTSRLRRKFNWLRKKCPLNCWYLIVPTDAQRLQLESVPVTTSPERTEKMIKFKSQVIWLVHVVEAEQMLSSINPRSQTRGSGRSGMFGALHFSHDHRTIVLKS